MAFYIKRNSNKVESQIIGVVISNDADDARQTVTSLSQGHSVLCTWHDLVLDHYSGLLQKITDNMPTHPQPHRAMPALPRDATLAAISAWSVEYNAWVVSLADANHANLMKHVNFLDNLKEKLLVADYQVPREIAPLIGLDLETGDFCPDKFERDVTFSYEAAPVFPGKDFVKDWIDQQGHVYCGC
jgi:hypothetical protein